MATIRYCSWANGYDHSVARDRTTAIEAWSSSTTYATDAVVHDGVSTPNRKVYKSLQNSNTNHAVTDTDWWTLIADGSSTLPYQSITDASAGLSAASSDEWRAEASAAPTALGDAAWTANSKTVTFAGVDLTGQIAAYDFIGKATAGGPGDPETWWEVLNILYTGGDTVVTLVCKYSGSTATVASSRLNPTDTGTAASDSTVIQTIATNGVSSAVPLVGSGGWNLATQTRDGSTWFRQTGTARKGYGLSVTGTYASISHIGLLRYYRGFFISATNATTTSCTANSCGTCYYHNSTFVTYASCVADGGSSYGFLLYGVGCSVTSCTADSCYQSYYIGGGSGIATDSSAKYAVYGFYVGSSWWRIDTCTAVGCDRGFYVVACQCAVVDCTATSNTTGAYFSSVLMSPLVNFSGSLNSSFVSVSSGVLYSERPCALAHNINGAGNHTWYFEYGKAELNSAEARGGSGDCWKFTPTNTTYFISTYEALQQWQSGGSDVTLGVWVKTDGSWNGTCYLEAWFESQRIAGPTSISPTSSYARYTITAPAASLTRAGFVELRLRCCKGATAGSLYLDDFQVAS